VPSTLSQCISLADRRLDLFIHPTVAHPARFVQLILPVRLSLRYGIVRTDCSPEGQEEPGIGQPGISPGIIGIGGDRLFEKAHRLRDIPTHQPGLRVAALQVQFVRFETGFLARCAWRGRLDTKMRQELRERPPKSPPATQKCPVIPA